MAKRVRIGKKDSKTEPIAEKPGSAGEAKTSQSTPPEAEPKIRVRKKQSDSEAPSTPPESKAETSPEPKRRRIKASASESPKSTKRISKRRDKPLETMEPEQVTETDSETESESIPEGDGQEASEQETPKPRTRTRKAITEASGDDDSTKRRPPEGKKKSRPNLIIIGIVAVFIVVAVWASKKKPVTNPAKIRAADLVEVGADKGAIAKFKLALQNKGKAIAIGKNAVDFETKGLQLVSADDVPGLDAALDSENVHALIMAMQKAGIRHLLIDPSIAKRNPIPPATVRNRLALGRPTGALSAKLLSKKLFYYEIGQAPLKLSHETKKTLTAIARDTFNGGQGRLPSNAPPILSYRADWALILTVRPLQSGHISYHSQTGDNLAVAAANAGRKAKRYFEKRESLGKKLGPLKEALAKKITLEIDVVYDEGTFFGPRDNVFMWRIIEPGINGVALNIDGKIYYQPPWYTVTNNLRPVFSVLEKISRTARQDKNYWKGTDVPIERFRTVHWRERTPGGEIEDLYRAAARVPSMADVTRKNLIASLQGLGDWIADNQTAANGRYTYRYFPTKDRENAEYNFVRHCLGPFSMALTEEFTPHPKYRQKADAGMRFIEDHIRWGGPPRNVDGTLDKTSDTWMGKPLPGDDVAIVEFMEPHNGEWSSKMGAVAVTILGYTQYKRVGWNLGPERERVLKGLANFLLYMQNEEEGNFHHYYVGTRNHYYGTRNSIYPGEILYAVARLYGETKEDRFKVAFLKAFKANLKWFKDQMAQRLADGTYEEEHRKNLVQFQPWMAMALDEMYRYDPNPEYVEASNLVSLWILDTFQYDEKRSFFPDKLGGYMKVLDELPAMHTFVYTEGTAASFDLAKRAGSDPKIVEKLRRGAMMSARFIMQMQARPGENDYYYLNPQRARGGVRYCMNHNKQRIDYTYHALSSIYRILKGATDKDYEAVQSIPMPPTW